MFANLETDPAPLLNFLDHANTRRLGFYFESLVLFWLKNDPRFRVIAHNIQVEEEGRTVGEVDLIVEDYHLNRVEHWELAVKFYLQYHIKGRGYAWLGPNRKDNLQDKIDRLENVQSKLSDHEQIRNLLYSYDYRDEVGQRIFLKGMLFYPLISPVSDPALSPYHLKGNWIYVDQFSRVFDKEHSFKILSKFHWITSTGQDVPDKTFLCYEEALEHLRLHIQHTNKVLMLEVAKESPISRIMIAGDEWPIG